MEKKGMQSVLNLSLYTLNILIACFVFVLLLISLKTFGNFIFISTNNQRLSTIMKKWALHFESVS